MSLVTQEIRATASYIYHGTATCQEKAKLLYKEMRLPTTLLSFEDIEEFGYVKDTGFVWFRQKKPNKTSNEKIGKLSSNATEVTGFLEKFKIKKLTCVKGKELLLWITISEVVVDYGMRGKVIFKTSSGIGRSYPLSAFQIDDVKKDVGGVGVAKDVKT